MPEKNAVDIDATIRKSCGLVECFAKSKGLTLLIEHKSPLPKLIESDDKRIRGVLVELLSWIVKQTHFGSVTLRTKIHNKDNKEFIKCSIKGTGVNFSQDILSSAFEISSGLHAERGLKMNFFTSKSIIELLGGDFWIKSKLGKNSSLKFTLPIVVFSVLNKD